MLLMVSSVLIAQESPEPIFLFEYRDAGNSPTGETLVYGLWDQKKQSLLNVEILEPWRDTPRSVRVNPRYLAHDPAEAPKSLLREYLDEGWKAAGGRQVVSAQGETIWVHGDAAAAHEAALRLRAQAFPEPVTPDSPPSTAVDLGGDDETPQPSFLQLWGLHIAITAAGLLAAAAIAWWAFSRHPWASVQT